MQCQQHGRAARLGKSLKIYLAPGDQINWAVDQDLRHMMRALDGLATITDLDEADAVLAIWWAPLVAMDPASLHGKRVFCFMQGDPIRFFSTPAHRKLFGQVGLWAVRSRGAENTLRALGFPTVYMPYMANTDHFGVIPPDSKSLQTMAGRLGPRSGRYLVANFARDTEGQDLRKPKLVKGPDMFAEIMRLAQRRGLPIKAVLAGPRRHWLRERLQEFGVPFSYIGEVIDTDDIDRNILPREALNLLYNLVDLTVCSSRSEGGPLAVCEAPLAGCKMISTPVGMAPDVLPHDAVFRDMQQAVDMIAADIERNALADTLRATQDTLARNHSIDAARSAMEAALKKLVDCPPWQANRPPTASYRSSRLFQRSKRVLQRVAGSLVESWAGAKPVRVALAKAAASGRGAISGDAIRSLIRAADHVIVSESAAERADVLILDALTDWPLPRPLTYEARLVALVNATEDPAAVKHLVANLTALYDQPSFTATLLPTPDLVSRLAKAGHAVKFPVLVAPPVNQTLFYPPVSRADRANGGGSGNGRSSVLFGPTAGPIDLAMLRDILPGNDWEVWISADQSAALADRQIDLSDAHARAEAFRGCTVYVEFQCDTEAAQRLREALSCAAPIAYRDTANSRRIVGFGGHPFDGDVALCTAIEDILKHLNAYRRLAVLDSDDVSIWDNVLGTTIDA